MILQCSWNVLFRRVVAGLTVVAAVCLTSCADYVTRTPEGVRQRGVQPGEGMIVGSFDFKAIDSEGKPYEGGKNGAGVWGKGTDGKKFELNPMSLDGGKSVFAVPVPAGDYEITGWTATGLSTPGTPIVRNRLPMKVPFRVGAGEAVYVGRMNAYVIMGKSLIGVPVMADGLVLSSDHYAADVPWIIRDYPVAKGMKMRKSDVSQGFMREIKRTIETPKSLREILLPGL